MPNAQNFQTVFDALRRILQAYEAKLIVTANNASNYSLNTPPTEKMKNKQGFFGAVQTKKNYVSYYLMPVYAFPDLLKGISPELRKRMQGKSCFNFTTANQALFKELAALTRKGYDRYRKEQMM